MSKLLLLLLVASVFTDDDNTFRGDQVLRITPKTDSHLQLIKKLIHNSEGKVNEWTEANVIGQNTDVHVSADYISDIIPMLSDVPYSVMIKDVAQAMDDEQHSNQKNGFYGSFDYAKYNQYSEIKFELGNLARKYRKVAKIFEVGKTYSGDVMKGIKITDGKSMDSKPAIWIDGGIHAREWISTATVMYFIKKLLTDTGPVVQAVLSKYDFYLLPVFNVDGYKYTFTSRRARIWRKTRSYYYGCYGADPNRNWGYKWGGAGTSGNPCKDTYRGPQAFSEVEVRNVAQFLKTIPNLKSYWNVHAYSQLVLTPWSYTAVLPSDYTEIKRVADVFVKAVAQRYGTSYKAGPPSRILYPAAGGSIDWTYAVLGVKYSYALELRDRGSHGFLLPADQIIPSGEETSDAWLAAISAMN